MGMVMSVCMTPDFCHVRMRTLYQIKGKCRANKWHYVIVCNFFVNADEFIVQYRH